MGSECVKIRWQAAVKIFSISSQRVRAATRTLPYHGTHNMQHVGSEKSARDPNRRGCRSEDLFFRNFHFGRVKVIMLVYRMYGIEPAAAFAPKKLRRNNKIV